MRITNLIIILIALFFTTGTAQNINRDSLRQIAADESLPMEERQKAGKVLIEMQRKKVDRYMAKKSLKDISFRPFRDSHALYAHKLDSLTEELTFIVLDEQFDQELRKKAIDLLVKINNPMAQQFLIDNLTSIYIPQSDGGADGELMAYYVFYGLAAHAEDNWSLIPIIFESLATQKSEEEIFLTHALLLQILGDADLIKAISESYLKEAVEKIHRQNISQIFQLN